MKLILKRAVTSSIGNIPAQVNGKPTVVDLPDAEARTLINQYKAKLTNGEKVNFTPKAEKVSK